MSTNSFYSPEELSELGFASYGENVLISRNARFYSPHKMSLGNDVRIDDFCLLSGRIRLGNNIHISAASLIYAGDAGVWMGDYSNLSPRSTVFAASDDFTGKSLISPMVPKEYCNVQEKPVHIGKFANIGSGCTIMPGADIGEGCAVGACSLVLKPLEPWGIYFGAPARRHGERSRDMIKLAEEYEQSKKTEDGKRLTEDGK